MYLYFASVTEALLLILLWSFVAVVPTPSLNFSTAFMRYHGEVPVLIFYFNPIASGFPVAYLRSPQLTCGIQGTCAPMLEQKDEWAAARRYMTVETVAAICEDSTIDPAKIAALLFSCLF